MSKDPPIVEGNYVSGLTVVDIGDARVARGKTRRPFSSCNHGSLVYDEKERRIWCKDCESDVDAFDAFLVLVNRADGHIKYLKDREKRVAEAESFQLRSLAAKALDDVWRRSKMVPACPNCKRGLLPEDFKDGVKTHVGRDFERALRQKQNQK